MDTMNIMALSDMLKSSEADSDSEDDKPTSGVSRLGPGDIGAKPNTKPVENDVKEKTGDPKDIWDCVEVNEGAQYDDMDDSRSQPQYTIWYKQAVTSEDMFLQMGNKTCATSSCEHMVVQVDLPDTKMADVDLDVKAKFLHLTTPVWRLALHLPHPVDANSGNAKWDSSKSQLTVTLRMNREYDYINF